MKLLLDTHVFLWFISGETRLPKAMREVIRDPQIEVFLSVVSLWEAIVKQQIGKLPGDYPHLLRSSIPGQKEKS